MSNTLTHQYITSLPEVETSHLRELQWSVQFNRKLHGESRYKADAMWDLWKRADGEQADDLFAAASTLEEQAMEAWQLMNKAEAELLPMLS